MALALGSSLASKVYLGATEINLAYFGATQVYSSVVFSAEAQNYFSRLDTAGDTTYVAYKQPLANYIDGLVANSIWDTLTSSALFVGVGIQGVTVPLKSTMPTLTNNNFVSGDLSQTAGLTNASANEYLLTGTDGSDYAQDDVSFSVYMTALPVANTGHIGTSLINGIAARNNPTSYITASHCAQAVTGTAAVGLQGTSRSGSAGYDYRTNQTTANRVAASTTPATAPFWVFGTSGFPGLTQTIATYHTGTALNLATLEALQEQLLAELQYASFSAQAASYFYRLDAAGDTTYAPYKQPLANYIDGLVALGGAYWDDMGSAASFVGVGIQGVTVPLKSTMTALTNNNFVAGDLNQLTGLKGDASTKYLDTGSKFNDFPQNDFSMSANITEFIQETTLGNYLAYQSFGDGISQISTQNDAGVSPNNLVTRCNTRNAKISVDLGSLEDFYGINRTVSTEYAVQYGASSLTVTEPSQAPANQIISILGASSQLKSNARMATYHIGPALNLATLRGLQATLLTEVAAI